MIDNFIPERIYSLKVSVLRLTVRARNALEKAGIRLIKELVELRANGYDEIRGLGNKSIGEIELSIDSFLAVIRKIPRDELNLFITSGNTIISFRSGFGEYHYELFCINNEIAHLPTTALQLSPRSSNALAKINVNTVSDLLDLRSREFDQVEGLGSKSINELEDSLYFLCQLSRNASGHEIKNVLDPRPVLIDIEVSSGDKINLIEVLADFSKRLFELKENERAWQVLKSRYGLENDKAYTLEELGSFFDVSRERIRQIQAQGEKSIKNALFAESESRHWRVPEIVSKEAKTLELVFKSVTGIITETELISIFENRYETKISISESKVINFLMGIYGFEQLSKRITTQPEDGERIWKTSSSVNNTQLKAAISNVRDALRSSVLPLTYFDVKIAVNRQRKSNLSDIYIQSALKACPEIEDLGQDCYQIKFQFLATLADKSYRVLRKEGEPLHFRDIARRINQQLFELGEKPDVGVTGFHGQLISDDRFKPIGRSGRWCLSEWEHIHTDSTIETMKAFFHGYQRQAEVNEIYEYVKIRRPNVPKNSINTLLQIKPDVFRRVSKKEYELAEWGNKEYVPEKKLSNKSSSQISKAITEVFSEQEVKVLLLSEVVSRVTERTGLSKRVVNYHLRKAQNIEVENGTLNHRQDIVVKYIGEENIKEIVEEKAPGLSQIIPFEVTEYLNGKPGRRARVIDVVKYVVQRTDCKRPTVYKYLDDMNNLEKDKVGSKLFCTLKPSIINTGFNFERKNEISDESLKNNLATAIGNLTIANVDAGLFQLGKIFENVLKDYLVAAREAELFPVHRKDLSRLTDMIDCVVKNKIISKGHHLDLLREKRNERAHNQMPNFDERNRLMQHVPFLLELYLEYIILLHKKSNQLTDS